MSWNDEDEVRELRETLAALRAGVREVADEIDAAFPQGTNGDYADRLRGLAAEDEEDED